jgi:hypothetical protein
MSQVSETYTMTIAIRDEPNFDGAFRQMVKHALRYWEVDDCGHINKIPGLERSECSIKIQHIGSGSSHGMGGAEFWYRFETWIDQVSEEMS